MDKYISNTTNKLKFIIVNVYVKLYRLKIVSKNFGHFCMIKGGQ